LRRAHGQPGLHDHRGAPRPVQRAQHRPRSDDRDDHPRARRRRARWTVCAHHRRHAERAMRFRRAVSRDALVAPPRMATSDLLDEAVSGLFARPGRMVLTILGTVVGLAALVATVGLSSTGSNRVAGRSAEMAATEILVTVRPSAATPGATIIPWDAPARLQRLNGVVAAGTVS